MPICPYCNYEIHIEDFFHIFKKETKKGKIKVKIGDFKGEVHSLTFRNRVRIWACPKCDKVLGFSEKDSDRAM